MGLDGLAVVYERFYRESLGAKQAQIVRGHLYGTRAKSHENRGEHRILLENPESGQREARGWVDGYVGQGQSQRST